LSRNEEGENEEFREQMYGVRVELVCRELSRSKTFIRLTGAAQ
jgi:hypothetical protein